MVKRKTSKFDPNDPFVSMSKMLNKPKPAAAPKPVRKVKISPAGQRRNQSIGVSSSSRHRTHKPPGAKKKAR